MSTAATSAPARSAGLKFSGSGPAVRWPLKSPTELATMAWLTPTAVAVKKIKAATLRLNIRLKAQVARPERRRKRAAVKSA
ncbi:MAG: hypothetical protein BWY87_01573 [Deltaproteobacteria bacterium ADurb.Bin510]|nr:MAG: hypothetical protein BWY87_01573 [Deltaproteobacteria bacterium ADurb.Bin510]